MWSFAGPVTAWTNAFLQPPPPQIAHLFEVAGQCQPVADALVSGFATPDVLAAALAEPAAIDAFIAAATASLDPVA